jgi:D-glycero-D-manno-heptose 1,7-bisphosphate phosphatase
MAFMITAKKFIILDRDGVINQDSPDFIKSPKEWIPIPGSLEAIARLNAAGFRVLVTTNQSGIGRGLLTHAAFEQIQDKFMTQLKDLGGEIEKCYFCPHTSTDNCACRKPKPGLLYQIAKDYAIDFTHTPLYCIGDSLRDLQAALATSCMPVLVGTGNGLKTHVNLPLELQNTPFYPDLAHAVSAIIEKKISC